MRWVFSAKCTLGLLGALGDGRDLGSFAEQGRPVLASCRMFGAGLGVYLYERVRFSLEYE